MFFQTGIDIGKTATKKVTLLVFPLLSYYKISKISDKGKKIFVIPSHRVLLKNLPDEIKDTTSAEKYIKEFLKFLSEREILWKLWWENGKGKVLFAEPENKLPKGAIWDAEPISLARAFLSTGLKNGEIWDFGETKITKILIKNKKIISFNVFFEKVSEDMIKELTVNELPVLLSGGKINQPEIKKCFSQRQIIQLKEITPDKTSAFGAALWGVIGKSLPSFYSSGWELSQENLKKISLNLIISLLFLSSSLITTNFLTNYTLKFIQQKENILFQKRFPDIPPISPLKQVNSFIEEEKKKTFYENFYKVLTSLPKEVKIFSINYEEGIFKITIEVSENEAQKLKNTGLSKNITSVKKLPGGNEILELCFKDYD